LYGINCEVLGRVVYNKEHGYVTTKLSGDDLNIRVFIWKFIFDVWKSIYKPIKKMKMTWKKKR